MTKVELNRRGRRHKPNYQVRYKPSGEKVICYHSEEMWCQNCVNFGEEVEVTLENGEKSKGRIVIHNQST